jgi:mannose-1-phosphate guanylyltransferase
MNISVDYGIMEKADNVYVIPVDFGWSDLGTWKSVFNHQQKDKDGNYIQGQVFAYDTTNTLVKLPNEKLAIVQGLDNYMVIEHEGVLMICHKEQEQMVKKFLNDVKDQGLTDYI